MKITFIVIICVISLPFSFRQLYSQTISKADNERWILVNPDTAKPQHPRVYNDSLNKFMRRNAFWIDGQDTVTPKSLLKCIVHWETAELKIFDMTGKLVKLIPLNSSSNTSIIDAKELDAGVYYYTIFVGNTNAKSDKLIIIK